MNLLHFFRLSLTIDRSAICKSDRELLAEKVEAILNSVNQAEGYLVHASTITAEASTELMRDVNAIKKTLENLSGKLEIANEKLNAQNSFSSVELLCGD